MENNKTKDQILRHAVVCAIIRDIEQTLNSLKIEKVFHDIGGDALKKIHLLKEAYPEVKEYFHGR